MHLARPMAPGALKHPRCLKPPFCLLNPFAFSAYHGAPAAANRSPSSAQVMSLPRPPLPPPFLRTCHHYATVIMTCGGLPTCLDCSSRCDLNLWVLARLLATCVPPVPSCRAPSAVLFVCSPASTVASPPTRTGCSRHCTGRHRVSDNSSV